MTAPADRRKPRQRNGRATGPPRARGRRRARPQANKKAGRPRLILLFKPDGVLCKFRDAENRPTLKQLGVPEQVYPAGRLDQDSEGLVLLTDDGWLAHQITHPRHKLPKVYLVQVEGIPDPVALDSLRQGVMVKGQRTAPAEAELLAQEPDLPQRPRPVRPYGEKRWLRLVLRQGRKRQVRHMTAAVGHPTLRLVRIAIGPLHLDGSSGGSGLLPGQWREASENELQALQAALAGRP